MSAPQHRLPETIEISHTIDGVASSFRIELQADGTFMFCIPRYDPIACDTDGGLFAAVCGITANLHDSR